MNNQILSVHTGNVAQMGPERAYFKDGASVFVKILGDNGDGTYAGSVAGNRVTVTSSRVLDVGSSFVATISGKNGTVFVTPKDGAVGNLGVFGNIEVSVMENDRIFQILGDLGMPGNGLASNLLKMMLQLGMNVDGGVLRGVYNLAARHKGKEKAAGEILLLLKDKGLSVSDEELERLLAYLEGDFSGDDDNWDWEKGAFRQGSSGEGEDDRADEKSGDHEEEDGSKGKSPEDIINDVNKREGGWFLVPYNMVENDNIVGAGVLRLLFHKGEKLKFINLNCYYGDKEYFFKLEFNGNDCVGVKFSVDPDDGGRFFYKERLEKLFGDVDVQWCDKCEIEGCGSEGEVIRSVFGEM